MWDRRFLFSDDRIIARLKAEFVPAVGNTHEIQNGRTPAREWFMAAARKVKPDVDRGITAQGFYVVGADGSAYAYNNNRSVERVLGMMDSGRKAFAERPPSPIALSDLERTSPSGRRPDPGTSIIRVYSRIRPVPAGSHPSNENVAFDHLWFSRPEVEALLRTNELPEAAVARLYRFAIVDNVRGEPDHWGPGQISTGTLKFDQPRREGDRTTWKVAGVFAMATPGGERGLEGRLAGRAAADARTGKITEWKLYGEAQAWGRSTYTPNPPAGKFPMVFAMVASDDAIAKAVPPQAIFYGAEYFSPKR